MGFILLFVFSKFKLKESSLYFQYIFYHCPDCADELAKWFWVDLAKPIFQNEEIALFVATRHAFRPLGATINSTQ
jgi:hypothetical protein